jgi:hypothetical protein
MSMFLELNYWNFTKEKHFHYNTKAEKIAI